MSAHRLAEARSLAYHAEIATRLRRDPRVLEVARTRVRAWLTQTSPAHYAQAWASILADTPESIAEFLVSDGDRAHELRQSTPFAGILSPRERWKIWREARVRHEFRT